MHPILGSARRRNLYLASWAVIGALGAVAWSAANPGAGITVALAVVVPPSLVLAFVCLSARYVCRAAPPEAASLGRTLAMHAGAGMVAAAVWAAAWAGWTGVLAGLPGFGDAVRLTSAQLAAVATAGVLLFWLSSLLHYLLAAFEQSRRAEARELGLEVLAREAELRALRAQIDPHFLFNGLQSISALTSADPAGARRMCLLLADFFRSSVRLGAEDAIRLEEEMAMVRAYLDIERVRYGPRLESEVVLGPGCGSCRVPPLILQPLVENAVRHGIRRLVDGGVVEVTARCDEAAVRVRVRNPFDPEAAAQAGTGLGLANVERRLAARFGREAVARWRREDGWFQVDLRFPRLEDAGAAGQSARAAGEDARAPGEGSRAAGEDARTVGEAARAVGGDAGAAGEAAGAAGRDARTSGEDARAVGGDARTSGEGARTSGEDARTSGEDARTSGEGARTSGEDARTSGEGARTSGEDARASGEDARASGEDARTAGEDAGALEADARALGEGAGPARTASRGGGR